MNKENFEQIAKKVILNPWYRWKTRNLSVGSINFGDLRSVKPISECYGEDRGLPIDRYYIENFLASHAEDIKGNVMEIGDSYYTDKFGGNRVKHKDIFHAVECNPIATIVGDLTQADHISDNTFDCLILTETLQLI
ncbi:MAG: glycosyl transferase family 2, partial [Cyanobacteriota bacterium ELA615]